MKTMKRMGILFAMLFALGFASAIAEEVEEMDYNQAMNVLAEASETLEALSAIHAESEDVGKILVNCQTQMMYAQMNLGLLIPTEEQQIDQFAQAEEEAETNVAQRFTTQAKYIDELGFAQGYQLYRKGDYTRLEDTIYDDNLTERLQYIRVEVARRPETSEAMVLFTVLNIDGLLTNSDRYLVYSDDDNTKCLYSRTFGETLNYRIDLEAWSRGQEYPWDDKLLYPAQNL